MGYLDKNGLAYLWQKIKTALASKQNTITADDGLLKNGDTLSVDNPVRGILTQAEFDALPEEEKAKGTYFVDDGQSGGSALEVYSTEETRIGTWIDGKPLYRKVIQATSPSSITQVAQPIASLGYAVNLIECSAVLVQSSGLHIPLPAAYGANFYASLPDIRPNGDIYMGVYHTNYVGRPVTIVLKYTKTTDAEVSG